MATFRHQPTGKRFFFVHIPRTAGRYVEANLLSFNDYLWDDLDHRRKKCWSKKYGTIQTSRRDDPNAIKMYDSVGGIEIAHFHKDYYEKYLDIEDIPHVSIVRNPIDRFISASHFISRVFGEESQNLVENEEGFRYVMKNFPYPESPGWFRPQVRYITNQTHVWKFEDGLGEEFVSWLSGIVGVDLEFHGDVEYPVASDEGNKLKKTPKLIHNLKILYKKDFEQFYSQLATSLKEGAEAHA